MVAYVSAPGTPNWLRPMAAALPPMILLALLCVGVLRTHAQEISADLIAVEQRAPGRKNMLPGELRAFQQVDVYARTNGFVQEVMVDRGSVVQAGQILARMSAPDLIARRLEAEARIPAAEAQRAEAEARLAAAQSTFSRLQEAAKTPGVVAENDVILAGKAVDSTRAQSEAMAKAVDAMRASVEAIRALEEFLLVKAPFAGVVTERMAHPGALAGPEGAGGAPLFHLRETHRLRLVAAVPEAMLRSVRTGAKLSFTVASHPGQHFTGTVARPAYAVDPQTRTMPVELDVANASRQLAPGMYAEVEWPVARDGNSLFVPPSAVKSTTQSTFVVRVANGKAEWVPVKRGALDGDMLEVMGNLSPGDMVLKRATDEVRPGTPVKAR
ncbi:MAG: efflux RND transporter periplasmic adaptor subunit [Bryobacterales bacterium]|nr:efflux RND transporter periplasmic adaptor subunit [Bryobacterales bacterium]